MASANESTASALTFPAATWLKSNCNMNHHIVKIEEMSKITQQMPPASHHSIELHHCPDRMKFIFETYCCNLWLSILAFSWSPVCLWSCPCTCSSRFPFCRPCCCPCSLSVKNLNPPSNKHKQPIPHEPSLGFSSLPSSPDRLQVNIYIYMGGAKIDPSLSLLHGLQPPGLTKHTCMYIVLCCLKIFFILLWHAISNKAEVGVKNCGVNIRSRSTTCIKIQTHMQFKLNHLHSHDMQGPTRRGTGRCKGSFKALVVVNHLQEQKNK